MREIRLWRVALAMGVMLVSGGCAARAAAPPPTQAPCAGDSGAEAREGEPAPRTMRICGRARLASERPPLLFVDGVEIPGGRLDTLDSDRIESIEIMRGPPAVAVYGPRAAEGVILVRTKRP